MESAIGSDRRAWANRESGRGRVLFLAFIAIVALAVVLGGGLWRFADSPMLGQSAGTRVAVQPGSGLRTISRNLAAQGLIVSPWAFSAVARLRGQGERLQAGVYEIKPGMTPNELLDRMVRGESLNDRVTIIEGWTFAQMRSALDRHASLKHDSTALSENEILERLGAIERRAEGLFFPDTYVFSVGTSDLQILRVARARMRERLDAAWATRTDGLPLGSPYEALILASVVEKETGRPEDRNLIASVFINRLRIGMRLQSDPTVIYGKGARFDGNLRRADLEEDTPYNSYVRGGLPPTPIALPGAASLAAVTRPAVSRALYFVARGDGTSEFSATLDDHNRAVTRYQKR